MAASAAVAASPTLQEILWRNPIVATGDRIFDEAQRALLCPDPGGEAYIPDFSMAELPDLTDAIVAGVAEVRQWRAVLKKAVSNPFVEFFQSRFSTCFYVAHLRVFFLCLISESLPFICTFTLRAYHLLSILILLCSFSMFVQVCGWLHHRDP